MVDVCEAVSLQASCQVTVKLVHAYLIGSAAWLEVLRPESMAGRFTCIGDWPYNRVKTQYKTPKQVIDLLVDIVSRNGNLQSIALLPK